MPPLTLGQAAKATGKQKSTILDAIRAGRLSASRDDKNQWQIDPAELFRVYPAQQAVERQATPAEPQETPEQLAKMLEKEQQERERERALLLAQIERERRQLESQIDDLKADRDQWRQQATNLLTHQPKPEAAPVPDQAKPEPTKSRLLEKLFGRKTTT